MLETKTGARGLYERAVEWDATLEILYTPGLIAPAMALAAKAKRAAYLKNMVMILLVKSHSMGEGSEELFAVDSFEF